MDNDDVLVGRVLGRREMLALLGGLGAAVAVGCSDSSSKNGPSPAISDPGTAQTQATAGSTAGASTSTTVATAPTCVVVPALTDGPYFVDEKLNRSDIRSDPGTGAVKDGAPLVLTFLVSGLAGSACAALPNATVDVWHCDALGVYSDASDPGFNTKGQKFLRGYQTTDAAGKAQFTTIYPGWYQGRAVHIHFKIRGTRSDGKSYEFTSQLFFDESLTDQVHAAAPYSAKGQRTLKNERDGIYQQSKGQTLLKASKSGAGYSGTFEVGVQFA
jgi:protocatechuate 3,4-dioxygenase beta subunit